MLLEACGICAGYEHPTLQFFASKTGLLTRKKNERELRNHISPDVDISFPIYETEGKRMSGNSRFVKFIPSPGCVIIVRDENNDRKQLYAAINGVLNIWPFLLISYLIASISGLVVWLLVSMFWVDFYSSLKG